MSSLPPPPQSRQERLPLGDPGFHWDQFESFCRDVIQEFFCPTLSDPLSSGRVYHYGKQGDDQKGIDLVAVRGGQTWVFQCRQRKRFNRTDADKTIKEAEYNADRYFVLVSCEATSSARDACTRPKWDIWDVRDLSRAVRNLEPAKARQVIDHHFGSAWRQAFLGTPPPTAFASAQQYFAPLCDTSRWFNHNWTLVGQRSRLDEIHQAVGNPTKRAIILPGRGGIGKSRILREFAAEFADRHHGIALRFAAEDGVDIQPSSEAELPAAPCVIVVDDAHRRNDLPCLLAFARRVSSPITLVLATRPHGTASILTNLLQSGYTEEEMLQMAPVRELSRDDLLALAVQALGEKLAHHAEELVALTRDCPLVTVVTGQMMAKHRTPTGLLHDNVDFRRTVLTRFADETVGAIGDRSNRELFRNLLSITAAIGPVREDNEDLVDTIADQLGTNGPRVRSAWSDLEEAGVLLRRGHRLRIVPDVLSDHILQLACVDDNGSPTGYVKLLFERFRSFAQTEILRSIAELDWRLRQSDSPVDDLLSDVWHLIEEEFASAPTLDRSRTLELLGEIAFYQPERVLGLVDLAMIAPAPRQDSAGGPDEEWATRRLIESIPPLLQGIGHNEPFLRRCLTLLWQIGRDDKRNLNSTPDHAIRILSGFAGYGRRKPLSVNHAVVDCVEQWLTEPDVHNHHHSPLDVLAAVLEREGDESFYYENEVRIHAYFVNEASVRTVRARALSIVAGCARSTVSRVAVKAIDHLSRLLWLPRGSFGAVPAPDVLDSWVTEQIEMLRVMGEAAELATDPLIWLRVHAGANWHTAHSRHPSVREEAQRVVDSIPSSYDYRLTDALRGYKDVHRVLIDGEESGEASERHRRGQSAALAQVIAEFVDQWPDATDAARELGRRISAIESAGLESSPSWFAQTLSEWNAPYAAEIGRALLQEPGNRLSMSFANILAGVRMRNPSEAQSLAEAGIAGTDAVICWGIAHSYSYWGPDEYSDRDIRILGDLCRHVEPQVRHAAIGALGRLGRTQPDKAVQLWLQIDLDPTWVTADEYCSLLHDDYGVPFAAAPDGVYIAVLGKLLIPDDISGYNTSRFLSVAVRRMPLNTLGLLKHRIERAIEITDRTYRPLPDLDHHAAIDWTTAGEHYVPILIAIRDLMAREPWQYQYYGASLFRIVSMDYKETVVPLLSSWAETDSGERLEAVAGLLREAPPSFVLNHSAFACSLIRKADAVSESCRHAVESSLRASVLSGVRSGKPGEPMPEDIEMRDRAARICSGLPEGSAEYVFFAAIQQHAVNEIQASIERGAGS